MIDFVGRPILPVEEIVTFGRPGLGLGSFLVRELQYPIGKHLLGSHGADLQRSSAFSALLLLS
jgi:hypothetical protein